MGRGQSSRKKLEGAARRLAPLTPHHPAYITWTHTHVSLHTHTGTQTQARSRPSPSAAHLDQQVALLVLQRGAHQQRQDLVEERARAKVARLVCGAQGRCRKGRQGR